MIKQTNKKVRRREEARWGIKLNQLEVNGKGETTIRNKIIKKIKNKKSRK